MKRATKYVDQRRLGAVLWQAQRTLTVAAERLLRAEGLGLSQARALMVLGDQPGLSGAALARRLLVTSQSAGTLLAQLDAKGWVRREPHAVHGAVLESFLTETGKEKLERVVRIMDAFDARLVAQLGAEPRDRLLDSLLTCMEAARNMIEGEDEPASNAPAP